MVVGRLPNSAQAIGAVSIGSVIFYTVGVFGMGLLLGLDTLVSQAFGAGDVEDCHHSLLHGIYLSLGATPDLDGHGLVLGVAPGSLGIKPGVQREATAYLDAIVWSTLPLLLHYAFRRYLQGMNLVRPVMFALFSANVVNVAANWVLVFGHLGSPALGVAGSGWATCLSRGYMAVFLGLYIVYHDRRYHTGLFRISPRFDPVRIGELLRSGCRRLARRRLKWAFSRPHGADRQVGRSVACRPPDRDHRHQRILHDPAGPGFGRGGARGTGDRPGDPAGAAIAGWTAIGLGSIFERAWCCVFLLAPVPIGLNFTHDQAIVRMAVRLLALAALFELFDGFQTVSTGALRGLGDTRTPMICHFVAVLADGLPAGWYLCFRPRLGRGRILGWIHRGVDPAGTGDHGGVAPQEPAADRQGRRAGPSLRLKFQEQAPRDRVSCPCAPWSQT